MTTPHDVKAASNTDLDQKDLGLSHEEKVDDELSVPYIDPKDERRLVRKLDLLIMPTVATLYLMSNLDRGNLGNAQLLGLVGPRGLPLDPDGSKFGLLVSVFFIGYAVLAIPFGLLAKRVDRPDLLSFVAAFVWGVAATASGAVNTWPQAQGLRFLLSVGEGLYQPVIALTLGMWYTQKELAVRFVIFFSTQAVAGCLNGLISYGLTFVKGELAPWRLLFFIDGAPTVILAFYAYWSMPGRMLTTKRLTPAQRELAVIRLRRRETQDAPKLDWYQIVSIFWSWPSMIPALCNMCAVLNAYVIQIFLPVLIAESGYSGATAQLMTLVAYGTAGVTMVTVGWLSDRTGRRGPFVVLGFALLVFGNALVAGLPPDGSSGNRSGRLAGLTLMANGTLIIIPMKLVWLTENAGNATRRSVAIPFALAVGQAISASTGYLFPSSDKPAYKTGTFACLGIGMVGLSLSILYTALCILVNRHRDRTEGVPEPGFVPDTARYADKAKGFRYTW